MFALAQSDVIPRIPLAEWTQNGVDWVTTNFDWLFDPLTEVIDGFVGVLNFILMSPPPLVMVGILTVLAFLLAGWRVALFTVLGLVFIIGLGLWEEAMITLALVLAATVVCLIIGIPVGIVAAKNRGVEATVRPILDFMQTMPAFVYLVPVVVLLSIGNPPAIIATVIFAMPPAVRLTMLGIQQVPKETVEAAHAFGATPWQTLLKVELPLSVRSIMAGVNQVIMLSLSMVVIAALVGAGGLGVPVLQGLGQLNVGLSFVGGIGIVIIAVILDRITRGMERGKGVLATFRSAKAGGDAPPTAKGGTA